MQEIRGRPQIGVTTVFTGPFEESPVFKVALENMAFFGSGSTKPYEKSEALCRLRVAAEELTRLEAFPLSYIEKVVALACKNFEHLAETKREKGLRCCMRSIVVNSFYLWQVLTILEAEDRQKYTDQLRPSMRALGIWVNEALFPLEDAFLKIIQKCQENEWRIPSGNTPPRDEEVQEIVFSILQDLERSGIAFYL